MEFEEIGRISRNIVMSGAVLGITLSGVSAGAEEPQPTGTTITVSETVGEPVGTIEQVPETTVTESQSTQESDDRLDTLGDGLQAFGMFLFVMTAVGFFNGTDSSSTRRRRY